MGVRREEARGGAGGAQGPAAEDAPGPEPPGGETQGEEPGVLQEAPRGPEGEVEGGEGYPEGPREGDRFGQEACRGAQPCVDGQISFTEIATLEPTRPTAALRK